MDKVFVPGRPATLLGVWAHPDDEAYLSAGLMLRVVGAGGRVACVHATDGEHGTDDPSAWPPKRLAPLRREELARCLATLGVSDSRRLGLPDGGLAGCDTPAAVGALVDTIREVGPTVIVTFGPDGMTGHPDHRTVSRWVTAAWRASGSGAELLYATTTDEIVRAHRRVYELHPVVTGGSGLPHTTPAGEVAFTLRLAEQDLDRKVAALAAHASQTAVLADSLGPETYRAWIAQETFRRPTSAEIAAAHVPSAA